MSSGISYEEALGLTGLHGREEIVALVDRADEVRRKHRGNRVDLCSIVNAKSGRCEENCLFCAQSAHHSAHVDVYGMKSADEIVVHAKAAEEAGAHRFCIVTRGRTLPPADFAIALEATRRIAEETSLHRCASMGLLDDEQAQALKDAGLCRYNHNLETARSHYPKICTTHSYEDRVATIKSLKRAGIETCVGGILNMGESEEQRIELAFELKEIEPDSVPMNFLNPRPGTPLFGRALFAPLEAVKYVAIFRLVMPEAIIRIAGGRAENFGELQALGIKAGADGLLIGNYLTTIGVDPADDVAMLRGLGLDTCRG
ncbi:MAG: biotin synthase BioB [Chloroflexi bacterium]|nr:biotin synthase BioB [Chloroflexota bacterium]